MYVTVSVNRAADCLHRLPNCFSVCRVFHVRIGFLFVARLFVHLSLISCSRLVSFYTTHVKFFVSCRTCTGSHRSGVISRLIGRVLLRTRERARSDLRRIVAEIAFLEWDHHTSSLPLTLSMYMPSCGWLKCLFLVTYRCVCPTRCRFTNI